MSENEKKDLVEVVLSEATSAMPANRIALVGRVDCEGGTKTIWTPFVASAVPGLVFITNPEAGGGNNPLAAMLGMQVNPIAVAHRWTGRPVYRACCLKHAIMMVESIAKMGHDWDQKDYPIKGEAEEERFKAALKVEELKPDDGDTEL